MTVSAFRSASSVFHLLHRTSAQASPEKDISVSRYISGSVPLHISADWLKQHQIHLNSRQQQLLRIVLQALTGKEPVSCIHLSEKGGHFMLERSRFGETYIHFERDAKLSQRLSKLTISDDQNQTLLTLGYAQETSLPASVPEKTLSPEEHNIVANSLYQQNASWQKGMFIVPFFTVSGEKIKVVGDYIPADRLRFMVKNQAGEAYAQLKRTQLENGELVWMLPEHSRIQGGATTLSTGATQQGETFFISELNTKEVKSAIANMRNELDDLEPPAEANHQDWNVRIDKTYELLDIIEDALPGLNVQNDKILSYQINEKTKGLLVLENKSPPSVYALVTHPDPSVRNIGNALIEQAKSISRNSMNANGDLQLTAINRTAQEIYEHWGFFTAPVDGDEKHMVFRG